MYEICIVLYLLNDFSEWTNSKKFITHQCIDVAAIEISEFIWHLQSEKRLLTQLEIYFNVRSHIYFRSPQTISVWGDDLFRPFDKSVWICILSTIFLLSGLMKMTLTWEHIFHNKQKAASATKIKSKKPSGESMFSTLLITFGAYFQQGSRIDYYR